MTFRKSNNLSPWASTYKPDFQRDTASSFLGSLDVGDGCGNRGRKYRDTSECLLCETRCMQLIRDFSESRYARCMLPRG
jgi:hypothetical protein